MSPLAAVLTLLACAVLTWVLRVALIVAVPATGCPSGSGRRCPTSGRRCSRL